jgi:hypothetical protein
MNLGPPIFPMKLTLWKNWGPFCVCFLLAAALGSAYAAVLPSDYTSANHGADGGDLLAAVLTGGIPHPSGYPAYLLLADVFQWIPIGTPYFKGALFSLVFSALAVGLAAALVTSRPDPSPRNLPVSQIASMAATGLALGMAPLFASQAVIVEVYGLGAFFTVCALLWLRCLLNPDQFRPFDLKLALLSILFGLGLGNHLTLLLLFPPALAAVYRSARGNIHWKTLAKYLALLLAAVLCVYAILPLRAYANPPINWGDPQSFSGFAWLVSARLYQGLAFGLPLAALPARVAYWAAWFLRQFGYIGVLLGLIGAVGSFSTRNPMRRVYLWTFILYSLFSITYRTNDSTVYLIPVVIVFAVWIGLAVDLLWNGLPDLAGNPPETADSPHLPLHLNGKILGRFLVAGFFIAWLVRFPATLRTIDPRSDDTARLFAGRCLASLPSQAVVLTAGDDDTFPLWYYHFGLGRRPDLSILVRGLLPYDWYRRSLQHTDPGLRLPDPGSTDWEARLSALNPTRPIRTCPPRPSFPDAFPAVP